MTIDLLNLELLKRYHKKKFKTSLCQKGIGVFLDAIASLETNHDCQSLTHSVSNTFAKLDQFTNRQLTIDNTIDKTIDKAIAKPFEQNIGKTIGQTIDKTIAKNIDKTIGKISNETINKIIDKTIEIRVNKSH